jgi:NAD-dependent deacetylase
MDTKENIKKLFDMVKTAQHAVALTGAGVSTLSGIRDFRGKNGLYSLSGGEYQKMFDIDYFQADPSVYYKPAREFIYGLDEKHASIVHIVLGDFEKKGYVKAIITQNIDLLHQKGGAQHVIEVHGSPCIHYCMHCSGVRMPFDQVQAIVRAGKMPQCPKCGRKLKPAITFFGEMLPTDAIYEANREASSCDLMLVMGTSLTVTPAAGLPQTALSHGAKIVIVNNQPTSLDRFAALKFDELEPVCTELKRLADAE